MSAPSTSDPGAVKAGVDYSSMVSWLRSIDDKIDRDEASKLFSTTIPSVDLIIRAFRYEGFDPKVIIKSLIQKAKAYEDSGELVSYTIETEGGTFAYNNMKGWMNDVQLMVTIFSVRGSNLVKIANKSTEAIKPIVDMLIAKYSIETKRRRSGSSLSSNVITIPRVVNCFPTLLIDLFHQKKAKMLVSYHELGLDDNVTSALLTPMFVCIIPLDQMENKPLMLCFLCSVLMDNVIQPVSGRTPLKKMLNYFKASYKTPSTTPKTRMGKMNEYKLITNDTTFKGIFKYINEEAKNKVEKVRENDKDLQSVLDEISNMV